MTVARAARDLYWAVAATINTHRQRALVRRVRRLAPFAVRAATPALDPEWESKRAAFCVAAARWGAVLDAHNGNEVWAYFTNEAAAVCVRDTASAQGIEVAAWDTRTNPAMPYFATYVDGYGPR